MMPSATDPGSFTDVQIRSLSAAFAPRAAQQIGLDLGAITLLGRLSAAKPYP